MGRNPPKWLPGERVKETILLQRKSVEQLRADRLLRKDDLKDRRSRHKAKLDSKRKKKLSTKKFISAQTILKHALRKQSQGRAFRKIGERVEGRRQRSDQGSYKKYLQESKIVLAVRARGKQVPPEVADAFAEMGLLKLYSARLICLTPRSHKIVRQLAPFSIIGHPDAAQLDELLRTRGALVSTEDANARRFISGNLMLENELGDYNILSIEDLVATIVQRTEHVEEVLKHIAPFDFHPPRQLFLERHRSVHQKLEVLNKDSFTAYLTQQLQQTAKRARHESAVQRQAKKTKK